MGEVIQLKPIVTPESEDTRTKTDIQPSIETITISNTRDIQGHISTEELYPVLEEYNPVLHMAMKLLGEGIGYIKESLQAYVDEDWISSDDAVQRFQALLPEMFCCRELGEGFRAIVNSVYHAINNMEGLPLTKNHLQTILAILRRIYSEPFIAYDEAVEEIMRLESAGFEVSPPHLKFVADLLSE
jgi:hypothetical protein